jgi:hypothetical protein
MMAVNEGHSSDSMLLASADGFKAYDDSSAYCADPSSEYNYQLPAATELPWPPQSEAAYEYWEELIDPDSGFAYYQNSYTGESRWDMPLVAAASAESVSSSTTEQQLALVPVAEDGTAAVDDAASQLIAVEEPEVSLATLRQQKLELLAMVHAVAALKTVTAAACRRVIAYRRAERKRHMDQVRRAQLSVRAHRGLASTKRGGAAAASSAAVSRSSLHSTASSADVLTAAAAASAADGSSALVSVAAINSSGVQLVADAAVEAVPAAMSRLAVMLAHLKSSSPWALSSTSNTSTSSSSSNSIIGVTSLQQPPALLRSIELTGDGIGDAGTLQLSDALKGGSGASLTYLSLTGNGITPKVSLTCSAAC